MTPSEPSGTGQAPPQTSSVPAAALPTEAPVGSPAHEHPPKPTRTSAAWVGMGVGAVILALIIVFIAQNEHHTRITFLAWHFSFAVGLLILASAVAGALVVVLVGTARLLQLRLAARRHRRSVAAAASPQ